MVDAEVFADHGFANIFVANEVVVGPHLTVVTDATASSDVAVHASGASAAWVVPNAAGAHATPAALAPSSHGQ
jgi:D-serine deaminase-like pyridoxal phosphate-dependent protein